MGCKFLDQSGSGFTSDAIKCAAAAQSSPLPLLNITATHIACFCLRLASFLFLSMLNSLSLQTFIIFCRQECINILQARTTAVALRSCYNVINGTVISQVDGSDGHGASWGPRRCAREKHRGMTFAVISGLLPEMPPATFE